MPDSLLQTFAAWLRPAPLDTVEALRSFVEERAMFLAQKCAIDYCRGKTGLVSYALFSEKTFLEALDVCRWETCAVLVGDLLILIEGHLRPVVAPEQRAHLYPALAGVHSRILASLPVQAHRPEGWGEIDAAFPLRLGAASAAPPRSAREIADHSARRLFDTLPIHSSYRELDEEVVFGAMRFRMIAVRDELERRIAASRIVAELLART